MLYQDPALTLDCSMQTIQMWLLKSKVKLPIKVHYFQQIKIQVNIQAIIKTKPIIKIIIKIKAVKPFRIYSLKTMGLEHPIYFWVLQSIIITI